MESTAIRCLVADIPEDEIVAYELIEEMTTYREFCVPAEVLNEHRWTEAVP
jgi:hypothetical protein